MSEEEKKEQEVVEEKTEKKSHSAVDNPALPEKFTEEMARIREEGEKAEEEKASEEVVEIEETEETEEKTEEVEKVEETKEIEAKETSESEDNEEEEPINPRLVEAARAMGWPDEKIIRVAETDESILEELATLYEEREVRKPADKEEKVVEKVEEKGGIGKFELDSDAVAALKEKYGDEAFEALFVPLAGKLNSVISKMDTLEEHKATIDASNKQQEQIRRFTIANDVFDKQTEIFPALGKTKDIKKYSDGSLIQNEQFKARTEIFNVAQMFLANGAASFDGAMEEAMTWYAGKNGVKAAQRKVVSDLKKRAKSFTNKPTRTKVKKRFDNPQDKAADIVRKAKEKAGL